MLRACARNRQILSQLASWPPLGLPVARMTGRQGARACQ